MNVNVKLSETEKEIFKLLRDCVRDTNLPVTLRVAGGWVRDKVSSSSILLGVLPFSYWDWNVMIWILLLIK